MDKFIDRQRLEAHFSPAITGKDSYTAGEVLLSVQMFPSADVQPVVHAHWIEEEDCTAVTDIPWSMCSACGSYSLKLPYCAFCGAKMDAIYLTVRLEGE